MVDVERASSGVGYCNSPVTYDAQMMHLESLVVTHLNCRNQALLLKKSVEIGNVEWPYWFG